MTRTGSAETKAKILEEALKDVPFDGWTDTVLRQAASRLDVKEDERALLYPGGWADLLEDFSVAADNAMVAALEVADLASMKIRERITLAVWSRIEYLERHREAALRASSLLALPIHAALSARLMARSCDLAWRGIGDTSTDFNFYTKRGTLSLVMGSTLLFWMTDESEGLEESRDFLDRRIENVMQFERAKFKWRERLSGLPSPFSVLAKMGRPLGG